MSDSTPATTPTPSATDPGRKLNGKEWLEIITMAKEGIPVEKIARAFKVRKSSIYRGLKKRGIRLGAYVASAEEVVENEQRKLLIERIKATKENDYKRTDALQTLVVNTILQAKKEERLLASVQDEVKTLKIAIDAVRAGTENKWKILGLDRDNEDADRTLPELPVRQLTEQEVAAIRDKQLLEDGDDAALEALDAAEGEEDLEDEIAEGDEA